MSPVAPRGDHQIRVSNAAERPWPGGRSRSQDRKEGWERSGGDGALLESFAMLSRILSEARLKPITGAPATMRSASAIEAVEASSVLSARASGPRPSATARAIAAVLPQ